MTDNKNPMNLSTIDRLATVTSHSYSILRAKNFGHKSDNKRIKNAVEVIKRQGYCILPNLYSAEQCRQFQIDLKDTLKKHADKVKVDEFGSDHRLFGMEHNDNSLRNFKENQFLNDCCNSYLGTESSVAATLGSRITYARNNLGSGLGWHRDSFRLQFKAILYLSKVTNETGPFQYIYGSHNLQFRIKDSFSAGLKYNQNRISVEQADQIITNSSDRLVTITGNIGDVIIADTSGIHRGCPLSNGTRMALTNYYYPNRQITRGLMNHLSPCIMKDY